MSDLQLRTFDCHCGKKHTIDPTNPTWELFLVMVDQYGEDAHITMIDTGKRYIVPKIYIAIHGVMGKDLPSLGFKEEV